MTLEDMGYNETIEKSVAGSDAGGFEVGRVISEQKERYTVFTARGECEAEITGNLRFSAQGREDFPAVGDWVLLSLYEHGFAVIHSVLPRMSVIKRRALEQREDIQIIAANIDCAIIIQAAGRDFNLNRLERYLTICNDSNIQSIIVITKTDLFTEAETAEIQRRIESRVKDVPVILLSNENLSGLDELRGNMLKGKTYCLLGSSGVGKSTLLNNLCGRQVMKTAEISALTNKGRHTTSSRELVILESGALLIDNPGMREVGISDNESGMEKTFEEIALLAPTCRFSDCTHTHEVGCAVLEAVGNGSLDRKHYDNFLKLEKERAFYETTKAENRKKDKAFGKMMSNFKKGNHEL